MGAKTPVIGASAPDFEVLDHASSLFHLKQALSEGGNILLMFYRGYW